MLSSSNKFLEPLDLRTEESQAFCQLRLTPQVAKIVLVVNQNWFFTSQFGKVDTLWWRALDLDFWQQIYFCWEISLFWYGIIEQHFIALPVKIAWILL